MIIINLIYIMMCFLFVFPFYLVARLMDWIINGDSLKFIIRDFCEMMNI
jgi:hypothetical protein